MSEKLRHKTHDWLVILEDGKEYNVKDTLPNLLKRIKGYISKKKKR